MLDALTAGDPAGTPSGRSGTPADADEPCHRGRPRDTQCGRAIEAAALELLVEQGFGRMSIEGVAARAGVAKTTVHRRWDSKAALVADAFVGARSDRFVSLDTGSVRGDLVEMLRAFLLTLRTDAELRQAFVNEQRRHPELAQTFQDIFLRHRRAAVRDVLQRGLATGELPHDADVELLADVGAALLWFRLTVTGAPLADDLPERIVDQFLPRPPG